MNETEIVTHRQWDSYATRIERANIKQFGQSLTRTGIARRANGYIIEIQGNCMIVKIGWRDAMRRAS